MHGESGIVCPLIADTKLAETPDCMFIGKSGTPVWLVRAQISLSTGDKAWLLKVCSPTERLDAEETRCIQYTVNLMSCRFKKSLY